MDDLCEVRLRLLLLPSLGLAPIPHMWMDDLGEISLRPLLLPRCVNLILGGQLILDKIRRGTQSVVSRRFSSAVETRKCLSDVTTALCLPQW